MEILGHENERIRESVEKSEADIFDRFSVGRGERTRRGICFEQKTREVGGDWIGCRKRRIDQVSSVSVTLHVDSPHVVLNNCFYLGFYYKCVS